MSFIEEKFKKLQQDAKAMVQKRDTLSQQLEQVKEQLLQLSGALNAVAELVSLEKAEESKKNESKKKKSKEE